MIDDERLPTGIAGIDSILQGGLFPGGVYLVSGPPGSGKTIFGNELCFAHARAGGKSIFCTLLAETHGRMIANIRKLSFFDERAVGTSIKYIEGFSTLDEGGLESALSLLRESVREHQATVLLIDGTVTAERMSPSAIAYKRFIQALKAWVDLVGCTVILLTSSGTDLNEVVQPEHTMVDGLLQLAVRPVGMRMLRELCVRKFRGSHYLEGFHSYAITGDGIVVWPRIETLFADVQPNEVSKEVASTGIARLDEMLSGGLRRNSVTLVVGATGVGKTQLGLHFLAEGTVRGEAALYFGLFEPPSWIARTAMERGARAEPLTIVWQPDSERLADALAMDLLDAIDRTGARRVLVDGMVALKTAADKIERLPAFFAALTNELRRRGVTTVFTEELRDIVNTSLYVPVDNISASCDNILFLRQVEEEGRIVRYVSVAKTRGSGHDPAPRRFEVTASGIELAAAARPKPAPGARRKGVGPRKRKR